MKKLALFILLVTTVTVFAQVPQSFKYQAVEMVIPGAVNIHSDFIPDVFVLASRVEKVGDQVIIELPKSHMLIQGDMIRLITSTGQIQTEVMEINSNESFAVELSLLPESIFVYGKKVDDFRAIDYDYIFSTGIGALQELSKENEDQQAEIVELNKKLKAVENKFQYQFNELNAEIEGLLQLSDVAKK